ncbi:unnamed protein product [Caenorhabditis angaria]|uniref:Methyltransferase domain-containing protein n=1 Tax=Caenorhabditis angaria TaxID=860376 RepID=A0A9P1ISZ8_9PELO|nr:unnamed protein product [Caenorhabditis angaria]
MSKVIYTLLCFLGIVGLLNLSYSIDNHFEPGRLIASRNDTDVPSSEFKELLKKMIIFSKSQSSGRRILLKSIKKPKEFWNLFGAFAPEVYCPIKVRIGKLGDGGKWTCNPWRIPENSYILSLGLNNQIDFEQELQTLLNNTCIIHGYDRDEQNNTTKQIYKKLRGTTHKATIGNQTTIKSLAKRENIDSFEILKIDIEGAEHDALIPFLEDMSVCQIYIEIHGDAPKHSKLLQKIAHLSYRLFSYEVNGYEISAVEYSFIHENCIEKYGGYRIANYLDFLS